MDDAADFYAAIFAARQDAFAGWVGGTTGQWVCHREPLTGDVIRAAFRGGPSVSCYTINTFQMTHVAAIDFDSDDGMTLARAVRSAMAARGATGYVEPSRRGGHLWVLLDRELPARTVRRGLRAFLRDASVEETPKVEIRPAQDTISEGGVGYPLRMPTMPHPKTGLRYPLLRADDTPMSPRLHEMLAEIEETRGGLFVEMAETLRPTIKDVRREDRRPYTGPTTEGSASDILRRLWGAQDARPNHTIRCIAHQDTKPSLSVLPDDQRAVCKSPVCPLHNDGRGRGTYELTVMAPKGKQ